MRFHERPYLVIGARRFSEALLGAIRDPEVLALVGRPAIGGLDQISDNVDLASTVEYREALKALY